MEMKFGSLPDHCDVSLEILPNGALRIFGNEKGYNAARDYFKFPEPFKVDADGEWCHLSLMFERPVTFDAVQMFSRDIKARSGVRVATTLPPGAKIGDAPQDRLH
jgi:hypothetical protein